MLVQKKRLHISPLTPNLLSTVLRPPLAHLALDISFHEILTFPEKSYGFVTLPAAEADHLRQKFHGSVLRGMKMQVKEARTKKAAETERAKDDGNGKEAVPKSRRAKRGGDAGKAAVPGVELEEGRKVKRGWTEPADGDRVEQKKKNVKVKEINAGEESKKTRRASSITGKEECLFKTTLPPNTRPPTTAGSETDGVARKRKRGQSNGALVVHEFKNTQKHAVFLRDRPGEASSKHASEFVDGKGWVDKDGNLVEPGPAKKTRRTRQPTKDADMPKGARTETAEEDEDVTSSSGTSSSEEQETEDNKNTGNGTSKGLGISRTVERLSITRSSATPPPLSPNEPIPTLKSPEPHPLETLFKRPAKAASQTPKEKPMLEVSTTFSFSEPGAQEVETRLNIPQTPFTQQDIRQRRERSAAPTPDTAAPGKTFGNVWGEPNGSDIASESDEEDAGDEEAKMLQNMEKGTPKEGEKSDFATWFYEHRGENNRAWKQRRREATKEKRQVDNRKRKGE